MMVGDLPYLLASGLDLTELTWGGITGPCMYRGLQVGCHLQNAK